MLMETIGKVLIGLLGLSIILFVVIHICNMIGSTHEIASEPYKRSFEECAEEQLIPVTDSDGNTSLDTICVRYELVYEMAQDILVHGRWYSFTHRRSLGRVDKDYTPTFDYSLER